MQIEETDLTYLIQARHVCENANGVFRLAREAVEATIAFTMSVQQPQVDLLRMQLAHVKIDFQVTHDGVSYPLTRCPECDGELTTHSTVPDLDHAVRLTRTA